MNVGNFLFYATFPNSSAAGARGRQERVKTVGVQEDTAVPKAFHLLPGFQERIYAMNCDEGDAHGSLGLLKHRILAYQIDPLSYVSFHCS